MDGWVPCFWFCPNFDGGGPRPRHVLALCPCPSKRKRAHHSSFVSTSNQPGKHLTPRPSSPAPISVLHQKAPSATAKAGNFAIRTNLFPLSKPSQALSIHTRKRKPPQSKAHSTVWWLDVHYQWKGRLLVSPTSHRLQSFREVDCKI